MEDDKIQPDPKELAEKLILCEQERDEYLNGWKRAKADLVNAKKEWEEQMKDLSDYAKIEFIKQFLPVLDALDGSKEIEGWQEVKKLVVDILKKNGVEEIQALGQEFDPEYHETVAESEGEANKILEVLQKGYTLKSRVIRPAKVKIGKE